MSVVAEIERELARRRCQKADDETTELRTSTLTHLAWVPPRWLERARDTLAGLAERHPSRTILLVPEPRRKDGVEATARVREFGVSGMETEVLSEVIEVRLRGRVAEHPASVALPLLVHDLPVFCRWRGDFEPRSSALAELVSITDRLVVDSGEWTKLPDAYRSLRRLFERTVVSDLAWRRGLAWRARLAERWPGIRDVERVRVTGPRADAMLLAGWLRSRLRRDVRLVHRRADALEAVALDGEDVQPPFAGVPSASDTLSAELEVLGRDPVYEAAVRAAAR